MEENYVETSIQIFTDGSKSEKGVGSGIVIFEAGQHIKILQCRLNIRCTNNQAEQLAILKALEYMGCNRRNGPDFGRVFLMLYYTDITQNTYIQS